jgi:7,8-dihydropterin-6-yl-methyl-4-(beta-D-ribofuranosyl)aminobenzene 5'-phosphate synthase
MSETSQLTITILRDNVAREGLLAAHGLAMLAQTAESAFLLDTGDSDETWDNADRLGVDLHNVELLVLSHGHYDHTGGLAELLRRTREMRIVAHPGVFEPHWAVDEGGRRYIGIPHSQSEFEAMGAHFELSAEPVEIAEGVTTTGQIFRDASPLPAQTRLQVERDGQTMPDDFADDMSLAVTLPEACVILTGCAHAGVINIVQRCQELSEKPVRAIIGGTHLMHSSEEEVRELAAELTGRGVRQIAPLHCTGESGKQYLAAHFAGTTLAAGTGDTILVGPDGTLTIAPR